MVSKSCHTPGHRLRQFESDSKRGAALHYNMELDGRLLSGYSTGVRRFPWLAVVGLVLSGAGGAVEAVWWLVNGPTWENLYLFLVAGTPFWWTLGLHVAGGIATEIHWRTQPEGRWWALPGRVLALAWTLRTILGLLILLLRWVLITHGPDLVEGMMSKKRRSRRPRRRKYR